LWTHRYTEARKDGVYAALSVDNRVLIADEARAHDQMVDRRDRSFGLR
jgi:hypothetical protein